MIRNYFKIGWRNIKRQKLYTAINVLGLAIGICACTVIYTISSYELSFDTFHPDKERIYRIMGDVTESTGDKLHFSRLPILLLEATRAQSSGLEVIAGIIPFNAKIKIQDTNTTKQFESKIAGTNYITTVIAEPEYFDIFKYNWLAGNADNAMIPSLSVVLTESKAAQYFGAIPFDKMIGKQIIYEDSLIVNVAGIVKNWNGNSDLGFTDFISSSSLQTNFLKTRINAESWRQGDMASCAFVKLSKGISTSTVNAQLEKIAKTHAEEIKLTPWLEPLSSIHFNSDVIENPIRTAHLPTLYSIIGIAIFILLLAIINFINLSTAQSIQRVKEVGVRKVLGSSRTSLTLQFLTETFLVTIFAACLAIALVDPVLHEFRSFIPAGVSFYLFEPLTLAFLILVILITTLFAGLYPSKVISSYLPALCLKGSQPSGETWLLRKGLIVFQFSVSLVFIIGSIVISDQMRYTREKDLGFTADAILTLETPRGEGYGKVASLSQKIQQIKYVDRVALQWVSPMTENARGMKLKFKSTDEKDFWVTQVAGDENFIPLYQIKLLAGRNLLQSDTVREFVVNESLYRMMDCKKPDEAIGKILYWNDKPYPVVGVVSDFHTSSLRDPITPLCIINRPDRESALAIKLASKGKQSGSIEVSLSKIEEAWKEIYPDATFNYRFYDESLALLYEKDRQTAKLINTSTAIAVFISCIGLFGLTLFTSEKRSKEIGIRKIMGASITNIATMLGKDFVILVSIAFLISSPIAWYFMNQWLLGFAYHVNISWWVFVLAGALSIIITLVTVSFQAIKAAIANPVESLRSE
jgi:ABC-type antimicrobial peptide transport system permease subunit